MATCSLFCFMYCLVEMLLRWLHFSLLNSLDCLTLKMKASRSFETSGNIYQSTRCHIPEYLNRKQLSSDNSKSRIIRSVFTSQKQNRLCEIDVHPYVRDVCQRSLMKFGVVVLYERFFDKLEFRENRVIRVMLLLKGVNKLPSAIYKFREKVL